MAINNSSIASQNVQTMQLAVIDIVNARPNLNTANTPPETPGRIIGYYSSTTNSVELYCASQGGTFWLRMG